MNAEIPNEKSVKASKEQKNDELNKFVKLIQKRSDSRINNFNPNENLRATVKLESKN